MYNPNPSHPIINGKNKSRLEESKGNETSDQDTNKAGSKRRGTGSTVGSDWLGWVRWVGDVIGWGVSGGLSRWSNVGDSLSSTGFVSLDSTSSVVGRWVDDTNHTSLTMLASSAVEPAWSGRLDVDGEDGHHGVFGADGHEAGPETGGVGGSRRGEWVARRVERGLSNRVVLWIELELNLVSNGSGGNLWEELQGSVGASNLNNMDQNITSSAVPGSSG